jgi:RND family efflux transporter MFP subunit
MLAALNQNRMMNPLQRKRIVMNHRPWNTLMVMVLTTMVPASVNGEWLEAFTEPYVRIDVPAAENGVVDQLLVKEGDVVAKKQLLGKLDDSVLRSSLDVALAASQATGALKIAEAEFGTRKQQLSSYRELNTAGNATNRELARAELELNQAGARLQSVREEMAVRKLEYERVKTQIQQRQIESPIDGVVIAVNKEVGEFVSLTDPIVLHIVQLDSLKAIFSVPRNAAKQLQSGQLITLEIGYGGESCEGVIEFVSPIANPESNTVRVKVRIANQENQIPSGVTCRWSLASDADRAFVPPIQATRSTYEAPVAR